MAGENTSNYMSLPIPGVSVTDGPQWATDLNSCLTIVDAHNHTPGSGVPITPDGLNINIDLAMQTNNLTLTRSVRFSPQLAALAGAADIGCLYESGVDLWYNDGNGNQIQITQGGGVVGSPGSITGLVSPASATYVAADGTFVWQQTASTAADMDFGSAIFRNPTASSPGVKVQAPAPLGSDYTITLPSLPAAINTFLTIGTGGAIASAYTLDGVTLDISANQIEVKALGIGTAQLTDGSVTTAKLAGSAVTNAKIAAGAVTGSSIASATITGANVTNNIDLPGNTVRVNTKHVVVSNSNNSSAYSVQPISFNSSGSVITGAGGSLSHPSTGVYTYTFGTAFAGTPIVTATPSTSSAFICVVTSASTTACTINVMTPFGALTDVGANIMVIGVRA